MELEGSPPLSSQLATSRYPQPVQSTSYSFFW